MKNNALLLINVGSPEKPEKKAVRKFLHNFLNDKEVIDLPYILRKILVNLIIIPFRTKHSTLLYKRLWEKGDSPLIYYTKNLVSKLNYKLKNTDVYTAMRYGSPSLEDALQKINTNIYDELTILPLYPQYASSTTKSTIDAVNKSVNKWKNKPRINIIEQFYNNSNFIEAVCANIKKYNISEYDHILFSYHALPLRQINKIHPKLKESKCNCDKKFPTHGTYCYKATCYETTRLISKKLCLEENLYTTSFQSRMSKNWTKPFTNETLIDLAQKGKKTILVVSPSFVADCLETKIEIQEDSERLFQKHGGKKLQLVKNLNDSDIWVEAIEKIVR